MDLVKEQAIDKSIGLIKELLIARLIKTNIQNCYYANQIGQRADYKKNITGY